MIDNSQGEDTFSVFLRVHILLAMKRPKDAICHLIQASSDSLKSHNLLRNEGYVVFLIRAALAHELDYAFVKEHLLDHLDVQ